MLRLFYAASGFLITFLLSAKMTVLDFAKFNIYASIISVLMPIIAMGSGNFIIRTSNMCSYKKIERFNKILSLYSIITIFVFFIFIYFYDYKSSFLYVLLICLTNIILFIFSEYYRSESKFTIAFAFGNGVSSTSIISQGALISFLFLFFIVFDWGGDITNILNIIIFMNFLLILFIFLLFFLKYDFRWNCFNINIRWLLVFLKKGLSFSIMGVVFAIMAVQELWALNINSSLDKVSIYSLIIRICAVPMVIFAIAASYAQVFFIDYYRHSKYDYKNKIIRVSVFCSFILTLCCLFIVLFSNDIICTLSLRKYCNFDINSLYVKILGVWIYCLMGFSASFLIVLSDTYSVIKNALFSILIFWACFLILPVESELLKVSLSTFLSNTIYSLLLWIKIKDKIKCGFDVITNIKWLVKND